MRNPSLSKGFTLVEVIVALTLLSLIMLGLLGALRTLGESAQRIEQRTENIDELRMVTAFLRRIIEQAQPVPHYDLEYGHVLYFDGQPQAIRWVAPLPSHHGIGGLHVMHLMYAPDTRQLILEYHPYGGSRETETITPSQRAILAENVQSFALGYRKERDEAWLEQWPSPRSVPDQIRIQLRVNDRAWPELIIAPRSLGARL